MYVLTPHRELLAFAATLALLVTAFLGDCLLGGKVLSPADVLPVSVSFRGGALPRPRPSSGTAGAVDALYEPANRLLMDPVLQFQPWLEFNRRMIRQRRLPLWNDLAGCGAPHLANGQSAVFDPFHAIAYFGTLPRAHAWMAAARLGVAGLGMFLLAQYWGLGPWGRWFAGLAFPFCGFLVVWLLFPVTSVAVWMPWLFLASDQALDRPGPRAIGTLALASALVLLGGHIQTSAHVLLAAAAYVGWRVWRTSKRWTPLPHPVGARAAASFPRTAVSLGDGADGPLLPPGEKVPEGRTRGAPRGGAAQQGAGQRGCPRTPPLFGAGLQTLPSSSPKVSGLLWQGLPTLPLWRWAVAAALPAHGLETYGREDGGVWRPAPNRNPSGCDPRHPVPLEPGNSFLAPREPEAGPAAVSRRGALAWALGILLGIALAGVEVIPLAAYLARSPVWGDRARARPAPWELERPRLLDAICTAWPYAFGSQRRGHPNLARALGVHNLNESAGGFAGLATLVWLAPLAVAARRRQPRAGFLAGLAVIGAMGAFRIPPVANLLRVLPVVNVADNRRLTLWVAFALVLLGAIGIEQLARAGKRGQVQLQLPGLAGGLGLAAGLSLLLLAAGIGQAEPGLRARARAHYIQAAVETPGADPGEYRARAEHQVRLTLSFVPRYLTWTGSHLLVLVGLAWLARRGQLRARLLRPVVLSLTLCDLLGFGLGLNPAIAAAADRPDSPVIADLRRNVGRTGRSIGLGSELPPNTLMRYGLADVRNYDSIELTRSLDWFEPLYETKTGANARTSRRTVSWEGVLRARERLAEASVRALVAATPPPAGAFARVDRVGALWIARLDGKPLASAESSPAPLELQREPGLIRIRAVCPAADRIVVRETFDPGWRAELDGTAVPVEPYRSVFLAVPVAAGRHALVLWYDPPEVRLALATSISALAVAVFALTGFRPFRSTRIIAQGLGRTQAIELESES